MARGRWRVFGTMFLVVTLATMACLISGPGETNRLNQQAYWVCVTATPIPTEQFLVGTTTPPAVSTGTPVPTGEPIYGYTTPVPTETPYYRVGDFYEGQKVYANGIAFTLTGHDSQAQPGGEGTYHYFTWQIGNQAGGEGSVVPISQLVFVREVRQSSGVLLTGRWVNSNNALLHGGYPVIEDSEQAPMGLGESRIYTVGMLLPEGSATVVGLATDWERPAEGGVPVWFHLEGDPIFCPYGSASDAPPPTPRVLNDYYGGGGSGSGSAVWPATGSITSGFGCRPSVTGISSPGCPPDYEFHNGLDIANSTGTAVVAPVSGLVTYAGAATTGPDCSNLSGSHPPHLGYGNFVQISGANGQTHILAHLQTVIVGPGQSVSSGQAVGTMNSTGCSSGSHLHWSCYAGGLPIDPAEC